MNKISVKIALIITMLFIIIVSNIPGKVYSASEEGEELKQLLNEYKYEVGDIKELRRIIYQTHEHLFSATTVDESLKRQLEADVAELRNIPDMNPLILDALEVELQSQIDILDDSNMDEIKEEMSVIREWIDEIYVETEDYYANNNNNNARRNNT